MPFQSCADIDFILLASVNIWSIMGIVNWAQKIYWKVRAKLRQHETNMQVVYNL